MRKSPLFALTAVVTLALGIGGTTAMFTVIRAVLLKPLAYPDADRLVRISGGATPVRFQEMKDSAKSFSGIGAFAAQENLTLSGDEPEVIRGARVSANFLDILGVRSLEGGFRAADDLPGSAPVAMISEELWRSRFHADPQIAGKTVDLSSTPYTIAGVLPARFQFPFSGIDVWMTQPSDSPMVQAKSRPLSPILTVFAHLRPGVDLASANAEMVVIHQRYAAAHPAMLDAKSKSEPEIKPYKDGLVSGVRSMLWMLLGAVSFVLLITCANVASILLARATSRSREFAVRSALGASRGRMLSQLLSESILLSSVGGAAGVFLAGWTLRLLPRMTTLALPRASEIGLDWTMLVFACALSVGTGVLFGLAPSVTASRFDPINALRGSGQAANVRGSRKVLAGLDGLGLLVVGQVALSVVLLIGAGLLLESLVKLRNANVGFNPSSLLTFRLSLPPSRYDTDLKKATFFDELIRQIKGVPGISNACAAMLLPMTGFVGSPVQDAAKTPLRLNERPITTIVFVSPGYFQTLEIPLRRGRDFGEQDRIGSERVAVIDEAMAHRLWPTYPNGIDPIGQHLLVGGTNPKPVQIVGVVARSHQNLENTSWPGTVYLPLTEEPVASAMIAVRASGDPLSYIRLVRAKLRGLDRNQPISDIQTMDDLVDAEVGQRRLVVDLLGSFAVVALLLAVVGLYGVISYSVEQRVPELGIRCALGAQQADILWLVISRGMGLTLAGIGIGIVGALWMTKLLASQLFQVGSTDPGTYAAIAVMFALAALAASYVPARRAARIRPMAALRSE